MEKEEGGTGFPFGGEGGMHSRSFGSWRAGVERREGEGEATFLAGGVGVTGEEGGVVWR